MATGSSRPVAFSRPMAAAARERDAAASGHVAGRAGQRPSRAWHSRASRSAAWGRVTVVGPAVPLQHGAVRAVAAGCGRATSSVAATGGQRRRRRRSRLAPQRPPPGRAFPGSAPTRPARAKWCIRQVVCSFSGPGTWRPALVLPGKAAMTIRVRALSDDEARELARMAGPRTLGAGLVRRARIVRHAVEEGLSPWRKVSRSLALKGRRFETWAEIEQAVERATTYWNAHKHPFLWGRRRRHRTPRRLGIAAPPNVALIWRMHH